MIGAHKRTCVDHQNMPNHNTSIYNYHVWVCVWMAALKACKKRICTTWGLWTCMLPRELIWERVAPSHTGVTQLSDWPELQAMWSAPESPHKACVVHYINDVSLGFKFKFRIRLVLGCLTSVICPFTPTAFIAGSCLCCPVIEVFKMGILLSLCAKKLKFTAHSSLYG